MVLGECGQASAEVLTTEGLEDEMKEGGGCGMRRSRR